MDQTPTPKSTTDSPPQSAPTRDVAPDANHAPDASPVVDEAAVRAVLERLRPFLQADGGDLEFIGIQGGVVRIRLQGACIGCPSATYTLKMGIENQLKEDVPGVTEVVAE